MTGYNLIETDFLVPKKHRRTYYLSVDSVQFCIKSRNGQLGYRYIHNDAIVTPASQDATIWWISDVVRGIREETADVQ